MAILKLEIMFLETFLNFEASLTVYEIYLQYKEARILSDAYNIAYIINFEPKSFPTSLRNKMEQVMEPLLFPSSGNFY